MKKAALVLLILGACACADEESRVEEPVAPSLQEEEGNAAEESMDAAEGDFGGEMGDGAADDQAPADAEMAAPAPTPPGAATGGIISSGANATPQEQCKALETAVERKKCLLKLKRKGR